MNKLFYLFPIAILFASCEDFFSTTIDLELPEHKPLLVVNAVVDPVVNQKDIYVTHSIDPLSSEDFEYIADATVKLKEGGVVIDSLSYFEALDFYVSHYPMELAKVYQLEVSHPNYPTATAEVLIPTPVAIAEVVLGDIEEYSRALQFSIQDPLEDNYYLLQLSVVSDEYSGGIWFESVDPSFDGKGLMTDEFDGRKVLFNDQLFNGTNKTFSLTYDYWEEIDSVKVRLYTVSESYYKYHESRRLQNRGENGPSSILGAEPVVVYNNVQNGFGVFAARTKDEFVVVND